MKPILSSLLILSGFTTFAQNSLQRNSVSADGNTKIIINGKFTLFNNFYATPQLDDKALGLASARLVFVPGKLPDYNSYPNEVDFKKSVIKTLTGGPLLANNSGPAPAVGGPAAPANAMLIIDIEGCVLSPMKYGGVDVTEAMVEKNFKMTLDYVKWAREAVPGHPIGFYGHGLFPEEPMNEKMKQQLADVVDAFCPEAYYARFPDKDEWVTMMTDLVNKGHAYGKPVYLYFWHHYAIMDKEDHIKKGGLPLPVGVAAFQFETALKICKADGMILWGSGPSTEATLDWWQETIKFIKELPAGKRAFPLGSEEQFEEAAKVSPVIKKKQ